MPQCLWKPTQSARKCSKTYKVQRVLVTVLGSALSKCPLRKGTRHNVCPGHSGHSFWICFVQMPIEKRNTTHWMSWSQWALFLGHHGSVSGLPVQIKHVQNELFHTVGTTFEFPSSETWVSTLHGSLKHLLRPVYKIMWVTYWNVLRHNLNVVMFAVHHNHQAQSRSLCTTSGWKCLAFALGHRLKQNKYIEP